MGSHKKNRCSVYVITLFYYYYYLDLFIELDSNILKDC